MAESTLSLKKADFESAVGFFLGYGRGVEAGERAWTTAQYNNIDAAVRSGLRKFYFPVIAGQVGLSHSWSFLKPLAEIAVSEGVSEVELPSDFNGFVGDVYATSTDAGQFPMSIKVTGAGRIEQMFATCPEATGRPLWVSVYPKKGTTTLTGQRWMMGIYPISDAEYTLVGQYSILPNHLTGATPYCYGGAEHVETIRESCLAVAEKDMDDMAGVHEAAFQRELAASISKDRRTSPAMHGYNGDASDWRDYRYGRDSYGWAGNAVVLPPEPI